MPQRSEREEFDAEIFERNPFEGFNAEEVYRRIRWGESPTAVFELDAPEPMASLGTLAMLDLDLGQKVRRVKWEEGGSPYLAVGAATNLLYLIPSLGEKPVDVPRGPYDYRCRIRQIDYFSRKGGEEFYFYHKHEKPFPFVFENVETAVCIILPAVWNGKRSYAVEEGGIVG